MMFITFFNAAIVRTSECSSIFISRRLNLLAVFFLLGSTIWATIPAGYYYEAQGKKKAELKTSLSILGTPAKVLKYGSGEGATWQGFYTTDRNPDNSVVDMYSNNNRFFNGYSGILDMHIEHSLPKSWWGGDENLAYHDLFHLYPADKPTNLSKSNYPLGIVKPDDATFDNGVSRIGTSSFSVYYTGKAFEPADEFKGDFARSYLYIATIYENYAPVWNSPMMQRNTYPVWTPWAKDLLLQWNAADPVSVKERLRQEAVYAIQGNRNPFIDYPDLASYIWGPDTLSSYPFTQPTTAFLTLPRRGERVDFNFILQGDTVGMWIQLKGQNLSGSLTVVLKNRNPAFTLLRTAIPAEELIRGTSLRMQFCPTSPGTFSDTLLLSGAGLDEPLLLPVEGKATRQLMALEPEVVTPVGATLHWIADLNADAYTIDLFTNPSVAGDLLIASYAEGSYYNKTVEIYNGTGRTVQLTDYALAKQSNGAGGYESVYPLKGNLVNGSSVVVIHQMCDSSELKAKATLFTDSVMNFNGNDAIALLYNGLRIDAVGYFDVGPELMWGRDKTLHRKASVTHPSHSFNEDEWISLPSNDFSPLGTHSLELSTREITVSTINATADSSTLMMNNLQPLTNYLYRVSAIRKDTTLRSENSVRFTTASPAIPTPMQPSEIGATYFLAEWESDAFTDTFELEVYTKVGVADIQVIEGFDQVGSNAKPLPDGWTGTAGAIYTTTTSSGIAPPAIQLRNTGEWLQTPVYAYPVTEVEFMYRYPSSGTGNVFTVEVFKNGKWVKIDDIAFNNLMKTRVLYSFSRTENVRSIRITYTTKVSGNLALDDFRIVYGSEENAYLLQNYLVTGHSFRMEKLQAVTDYFYRVRSVLGNTHSEWSEEIKLKTLVVNSLKNNYRPINFWHSGTGEITFTRLEPGSRLQLYSITGILLTDCVIPSATFSIPVSGHPIYIVRIVNSDQINSFKILL